jgi:HSP20 family protein
MAVFRWRQNWEPFRDLEQQVNRLLESIRVPLPTIRLDRHYPPVNLFECENEYLLTAELPGLQPEHLEVTMNGGVLTLRGERRGPDGVPDERFRRHERMWGSWQRSLSIPHRVQEDKVSAELTDGVLKIRLPKVEETKSRQIPINSGEK